MTNNQAIRCDSSKSSVPPSLEIRFNERVFNEFQKNYQTGVMNSLYPNTLDDNLDEFEYCSDDSIQNPEPFRNEAMINTYKNDSTDDIFNKTDLNVSKSNSQKLDNSNLVVNSHIIKMSTNASISKYEKLYKSKLPIPSRVFKTIHKCNKNCAWCKRSFAVLDNANHIGRTRNNEMRSKFLKMNSDLDILSCICDRCWNYMKKSYYLHKVVKKKEKLLMSVSNNVFEVNVDSLDKINGEYGIENTADIDKEFRIENLDRVDGSIKIENTAGVKKGSEISNKTEVKNVVVVDRGSEVVNNAAVVDGGSEVYNKTEVNNVVVVDGGSEVVNNAAVVDGGSEVYNKTEVNNVAVVDGGSEVYNKTEVNNAAVVDGGSEVYSKTEVNNAAVVDGESEVCIKTEVKNVAGVDEESEVDKNTRINKEIEAEQCMLDFNKEQLCSKKIKIKKRKEPSVALCSIHHCDQYSKHPIFSDEYIRIKQIFSLFDFCDVIMVESKKKNFKELGISLSVCDEHAKMIDAMTMCQLCSNKLNGHLDFQERKMQDKWNAILLRNNIPLILKSGMFICVNCQSSISNCTSSSSIILDDLRQNYKKKIVTDFFNKKSFWCLPEVNIPNIYQESYINPLNDTVRKVDNTKKVNFTKPLITATYYIEPSNNEHCLNKLENKNVDCSSRVLDLLTDPELKSTEITKMSTSEISIPELNDKLHKIVDENLYCDDDVNPSEVQIKPSSEELNNSVIDNTLLLNIEKQTSQTLMPSKNLDIVHKTMPNQRIVKIMNLVKKLPTVQSEKLLEDSEDNSLDNLIDDTENRIFNEIMKYFSDNTPTENIATEINVDNDMLPLHVSSVLDDVKNAMATNDMVDKNQSILINDNLHPMVYKEKLVETKDFKNKEINQHSYATHVYSQHIDNGVKNLVNNQCSSVNTNLYVNQNVSNIENNEFNQYSLEMTTDYSHQNMYHNDESSTDVDENNPENVSTVEPNIVYEESDQKLYLLNSQNCGKPINRLELRNKLRNVVCQRISKEGIKKLRLNDTYDSNESEPCEYETITCTEENSVDINVNENSLSYDSNDIIEVSSDEDEEIFTPINTNGMKGNFSTNKLNTSSTHLGRCYALTQNLTRRFQCYRTLQKVDEPYSTELLALRKLSKNAQEHKSSYNISSNGQLDLDSTQLFSTSTINSQNTEFTPHNTINDEIEDLTKSDSDLSDSENNENVIHLKLNHRNKQIFKNVLSRFKNESDMVVYLMENYRMLYNGDLVLSETATPHASDCIHYHIDRLYQLYGDPRVTNASSISFASPLSTKISLGKQLPNSRKRVYDSTHSYYSLKSSNVPVSTLNNVATSTSKMHTAKTVGKIINVPFTNTVI